MIGGFDATAGLDAAALRALLATGAAEERVWAAWRLALDLGRAAPEIVGLVAGEPSAGVRRALLPVIAGHGEVDILVALARHDPSEEVRAASAQHVARLAAQGAIPADVVALVFAEGTTAVRRGLVDGLPASVPPALRDIVTGVLASGPPNDQLAAFDVAIDADDDALRGAAMRWLEAATDDVRLRAWHHLAQRTPETIFALMRTAGPGLSADRFAGLPQLTLATLTARAEALEPTAFGALLTRREAADAELALLMRGLLVGYDGYARLLSRALSRDVAPSSVATELAPAVRAHARARREALASRRDNDGVKLRTTFARLLEQLDRRFP